LKLDTKIDHHSKLCSVFKIFKMATNIKIQKWTDFNVNGYLQGVRHAAPYGDHFEPKMATKIQNPAIWTKFGFQHDSQKLGSNYFLLCSHTILHSYH
jgi:hypothetical protein